MPGKNVILKALVLALGLSLIAGIINAQLDSPHSGINGIGCKNCHFPHNTTDKFLNVTQQVPQDIDDTPVNNLCWSCHNDIVAPYVRTHSSITTESSYWNGSWSMECRQCHWPHQQMQFRTYGSEGYLYSSTSTSITNTTLTKAGVGWTADQYKGLVVIPNIAREEYNYKITGNTNDTLTIAGPMDLTRVTAGDNFAIVYGKLIKNTISTPNSGPKTVKFFQDTGNDSFADGDSTYTGVCEACHTKTGHFRNDGGGSDPNHTIVGDVVGVRCTICHQHLNGFKPVAPGQGHDTHLNEAYGPGISCRDCHGSYLPPTFSDGNTLANTTVCNNCHSPGGTYDGVNDPIIGVKNNWPNGVYNGSTLAAGKEKWCAGCHDEDPANSRANGSGVYAPNVIGDEDATTNYGTGYGYYITGHGLASGTYPASGAPAARKGCPDCHNLTTGHIDHDSRTYTASSNNYQAGYRLKYSMDIPRTDSGMPVSDFALCFECHNSDPYLGVTNNTNFRDDQDSRNDHSYHLTASTSTENKWDSDWDGSTGDSHISCPACHNVHGSPSPAMYRHGELISTPGTSDKVKFMDFRYIGQTCTDTDTIDPMLSDSIGGAGTRFYGSGPGSISKNSVCGMCHNEYWFKSISDESDTGYTRTPLDVANPRITWVDGQAGSAVLSVRFSEGVYNSVSGDLAAGDFSLTDQDNSRTIMSVTHTAGDTTATLTLDSSLDSTDDIGTDTLSAATTTSIYDASNNAMDTTPVTISEDTDPPAVSNQSPANGATDIAINSDLTFILSDSSVGVDWTTFSIQLSGNSGYSKTYTDVDTSIVSKTGPPDRYIVTVNPDADFGATEVITVTVNVDDMSGNSMTPPAWSFTAGSQGTITFQPSGLVSNPGVFEITPTDGLWADVLDCNDGDTSYVSRCCQWSEAPDENHVFTVDMDDPGAGLKGRPIEGITIGVYARYGNQDEEGGKINIGYSAGSAGGWKGETAMSPSSVYNLITMTDNYTGGIYYEDIENLDVSVRRSNAISSGLIVTEVYAEIAFGATIDTTAPALSNQSPANGSSDIAINSDLTFTLSDNSSGINWSTFEIQLSGDKGYSQNYTDVNTSVVSKTGTAGSYDVTVNPDTDFGGEEVITVTVNVDDQAGNSLVPPAWSFTSQAAGGPLTLVLHPSGVVTYENCVTQGGGWDTVLDSNDGYTTAAVCNSYFYYDSRGGEGYVYSYDGTFTVAMDPAGLGGGETIDRVTLYAWVEVDSDYPGDSLFELCFTGTSYCDLTSYNGGFIKISVDHPAPGTLDLDNLDVDGTGWSGYSYYYSTSSAAYYITEVGVEIVYNP